MTMDKQQEEQFRDWLKSQIVVSDGDVRDELQFIQALPSSPMLSLNIEQRHLDNRKVLCISIKPENVKRQVATLRCVSELRRMGVIQ
jgi:hypothetical protein